MNKYLKYSLIGFGSLIGLFILLAIAIPLLFENKIKAIFINALNKNLATEVVVNESDIHLSLLRTFPFASLSFQNLSMKESTPGSDAFFITTEELSLAFNVRDIINKKYDINKLVIKNAVIQLKENANGEVNYKFWKSDSSSEQTELSIKLQQIQLINVNFNYSDDNNKVYMHLIAENLSANGNFYTSEFDVRTKGEILSQFITISNITYLENKNIAIDTRLDVNTTQQQYAFSKSTAEISDNVFAIDGSFTINQGVNYDLHFASVNASIELLLLTLPANYANKLNGIQSNGKVDFDATIKGLYSKTAKPAVAANFELRKSTLYHAKFGDKLTDVTLKGKYTNGSRRNARSSELHLQNFSGKFKGESITGDIHIINFIDPVVDCKLNGALPASLVIPALLPDATNVEGRIAFERFTFSGNTKSIDNTTLSRNPPSGNITISNLMFGLRNENISIANVEATLENRNLELRNIKCIIPGADFSGDLTIGNWIKLIANTDRTLLSINGSLKSKSLDVKTLRNYINATPQNNNSANSVSGTSAKPLWLELSGKIKMQMDELRYGSILLNTINTEIILNGPLITSRNLTASTQNGNIQLASTFRQYSSGNYIFETSGFLNNIDITELFKQLDNFGQSTLTDKNIKGKANVLLENLAIGFTPDFVVIENSIYALANIKIDNGELINYKPLESLAKYIDVNELKHIRFESLQNQIEIKDRTVYIPATFISTSALDLYLSGNHTFDNIIDYQVKLSMADVMMKRFFKTSKSSDDYEKADGGINVYLVMTGTVYNPVIEFNKKEGKKKLEQSGLDEPDFLDIFKPDQLEEKKKEMKKEPKKTDTLPEEPIEYIDWEDN